MGVLEDIKELKIQGATNIALALLDYMEELGEREGYGDAFRKEAERVWKIRPTAVVAYNAMKAIASIPSKETIRKVRESIMSIREKVGRMFVRAFRDRGKMRVLTHCHSSEVVESLKTLHDRGMDIEVFVTETRPKMQGRVTARELADAGIRVKYIVDGAEGYFVDGFETIVVGSDSLREEGIVNKIGTLSIAALSREFGKEFVVVSSLWKIDRRRDFVIEMRSPDELGFSYKGVEVLNPAFDTTPWRFVDYLILEENFISNPEWRDVDVLEIGI